MLHLDLVETFLSITVTHGQTLILVVTYLRQNLPDPRDHFKSQFYPLGYLGVVEIDDVSLSISCLSLHVLYFKYQLDGHFTLLVSKVVKEVTWRSFWFCLLHSSIFLVSSSLC